MSDAAKVKRLAGDRAIAATTLTIPHPYADGMAQQWIEAHRPAFDAGESVSFAITDRATGELFGAIGLHLNTDQSRAELGYWIGKPYWRRGYATEAGMAVLQYGFDQLELNRIHAHYFVGNPSSGRVLEKLGMQCEGTMRQHVKRWGVFQDLVMYGILCSEYTELKESRLGEGGPADVGRGSG